jgi:RiboL-PSP-HEPN
VLVAGFLEQAMIEVALEHVRTHSQISIQRHVDSRLRRFTSANTNKIIELLGSFDADWRLDLERYIVDEYKDAVDSVVGLRHTIAHGRYVGVTMVGVRDYYDRVKNVVDHVADLCIP